MTTHAPAQRLVDMVREMLERDAQFSVADALGELRAAEVAGLIEPETWRQAINVDKTEQFVAERAEQIALEWDQQLESLVRWFGEDLIYEEAVAFLTRRSSLENVAPFVDQVRRDVLSETDERFGETLRLNGDSVRSARRAPGLLITHQLPDHWWWREDAAPS